MTRLLLLQARAPRIGKSGRRPQHADADRGLADAADHAAGSGDVHHAVPADHDRAAFPAAGAGHADNAIQPGADRAGSVPDDRDHTTDRAWISTTMPGRRWSGERSRPEARWIEGRRRMKTFLQDSFARKTYASLSRSQSARAADPSRPGLARPDPGLYTFGAENRVSDRRGFVSAVSHH